MSDQLFDDILPGILRSESEAQEARSQVIAHTDSEITESEISAAPLGRADSGSSHTSLETPVALKQPFDTTPLFGCPLERDQARSGWGILGRVSGQTVRVDLQYPKLMAVFGQIRSGKSYLAGVLTEMSAMGLPGINQFPGPESAVIIFNYRKSRDARFEYWSFVHQNDSIREINMLSDIYGISTSALPRDNLQVCTYSRELPDRQEHEYEGMLSFPLLFKSEDLEDDDWMLLMGLPDPDRVYIQVMRNIVEDLGYSEALSLDNLRIEVDRSTRLSQQQKDIANLRVDFAARYVDDANGLIWRDIIRPGTVTVVDLRRRQGRADDALRLCLVVLSAIRNLATDFHKFVLFDEFHEYYNRVFSESLDNVARMVGHHNWSVCLATQNTHKVDLNLLRLFSNKFVFQVDSSTWNDLTNADSRLRGIEYINISSLQRERGECYALLDECTDSRFAGVPIKLNVRPRVTKHGGTTAGQS